MGFTKMGSFGLKKLNVLGGKIVECELFNLNVNQDIDADLDCTGGPRANAPSPPPHDDRSIDQPNKQTRKANRKTNQTQGCNGA